MNNAQFSDSFVNLLQLEVEWASAKVIVGDGNATYEDTDERILALLPWIKFNTDFSVHSLEIVVGSNLLPTDNWGRAEKLLHEQLVPALSDYYTSMSTEDFAEKTSWLEVEVDLLNAKSYELLEEYQNEL